MDLKEYCTFIQNSKYPGFKIFLPPSIFKLFIDKIQSPNNPRANNDGDKLIRNDVLGFVIPLIPNYTKSLELSKLFELIGVQADIDDSKIFRL